MAILAEITQEIAEAERTLRQLIQQREALEAQYKVAQSRLADLYEQAARSLRSEPTEVETSPPDPGVLTIREAVETSPPDTGGPTIREVAERILRERNVPSMHYREVADEALRQGFRGGPPEKVRESFRRMMHKRADTFEMLGEGRYRLKKR
jgi:hypothetical protein